jgi:hypothetical protein
MRIINRQLFPAQQNITHQRTTEIGEAKLSSIVHVKGVSNQIAKSLRDGNSNLKIAFRTKRNVRKSYFTKLKDNIEPANNSCLIYGIPCTTCQNRKYIGQTTQSLKNRISGHKSKLKLARESLTSLAPTDKNIRIIAKESALVYHTLRNKHEFDFVNTEILQQGHSSTRLNMLEMLHIQSNQTVNKRTDCAGLSAVYKGLIKKFEQ